MHGGGGGRQEARKDRKAVLQKQKTGGCMQIIRSRLITIQTSRQYVNIRIATISRDPKHKNRVFFINTRGQSENNWIATINRDPNQGAFATIRGCSANAFVLAAMASGDAAMPTAEVPTTAIFAAVRPALRSFEFTLPVAIARRPPPVGRRASHGKATAVAPAVACAELASSKRRQDSRTWSSPGGVAGAGRGAS